MVCRAALVLVAASAVLAQPDEPPPADSEIVERTGVDLVLLDVVVLDDEGQPILGLDPGAFAVKLNGRDWPVYSVDDLCRDLPTERLVVPSPVGSGKRSTVADATPTVDDLSGIRYVLYFDLSQLKPDSSENALEDARRWVRGTMTSNDLATVYSYAPETGLRRACPFTGDRKHLLAAIEKVATDAVTLDPFPSLLDFRVAECMRCIGRSCGPCKIFGDPCWKCCRICVHHAVAEADHSRRSLEALRRLIAGLEKVPGRKALLLFHENSTMFPGRLYTVSDDHVGDHRSLAEEIGAEATLTSTAIYSMIPVDRPFRSPAANLGANLADFTGGGYSRSRGDATALLSRAGREPPCIYRIGLRRREAPTGRVLRARIYVRGRPLPPRYRVRFLDSTDHWWRRAQHVLSEPDAATDVTVAAAVHPTHARGKRWDLLVRVAIDASQIALTPAEGKQQGEWEVGALLSDGRESRSWEMLGLARVRVGSEANDERLVVHEQTLANVKPGTYRLRTFVRDRAANVFGGAEARIDLPTPGQGLVGPVLLRADRPRVLSGLPLLAEQPESVVTRASGPGRVPLGRGPVTFGEPLDALSWWCDLPNRPGDVELLRFVSRDGEPVFRFDEPSGQQHGQCLRVVDRIETAKLGPGTYSYHVRRVSSDAEAGEERKIEFVVPGK